MHQRSAKAGSCWLRVKLWLKCEQTNLADPLPWAKQTLTAVIVASCLWSSSIPLKVLQAEQQSFDALLTYYISDHADSGLTFGISYLAGSVISTQKNFDTTVSQRGSQQVSGHLVQLGTSRHSLTQNRGKTHSGPALEPTLASLGCQAHLCHFCHFFSIVSSLHITS